MLNISRSAREDQGGEVMDYSSSDQEPVVHLREWWTSQQRAALALRERI
jgi:hypothetical protein